MWLVLRFRDCTVLRLWFFCPDGQYARAATDGFRRDLGVLDFWWSEDCPAESHGDRIYLDAPR